jgi:outer membrane lipoprotein-sorting protein
MMKKLGSLLIILLMFLLSGCSQKLTICPTYPKPSKQVLDKIKSLNDQNVNVWMIEQYKLNKKLGVCNEL